MKNAIQLLVPPVPSDQAAMAPDESGYSLNIAGVYQDSVTKEWAMQTCRRATQLAGDERIQNTWFHASYLSDPGMFLDAVRAALAADVIVIAVHAAEELPLDLYVWIDAWLPRRSARVGALAAVIGVAEPLDPKSLRTREYLQAVARRAKLDFVPHERQWPVLPAAASSQEAAERAGPAAQAPPELRGRSPAGYDHCGLNE
jgi:hypothetical protein